MAQHRKKCGFLLINSKKVYTFEGINIIGRNKEAIVILTDPVASQHHAIITIINESHYISDLKSTNGTKLNKNNLTPYKLYTLEENDEIEFTALFKGKYSKLQLTASQLSNLIQSQNESQMTQLEDGFYNVDTQIHHTADNIFNDDFDNDISNLEINTQVINTSIKNMNQHIDSVNEQVTQQVSFIPNNINDVATQIITDTPTYLGCRKAVASTRISNNFSPIYEVMLQEEVATEVSLNVMETQVIISDSKDKAVTNKDEGSQMVHAERNPCLNDSAIVSSSDETAAVKSTEDQQMIITCDFTNSAPELPNTAAVQDSVHEEATSDETVNNENKICGQDKNDLPTSPPPKQHDQCSLTGVDEDKTLIIPKTSDADSASTVTQSLTPIRYSKRSFKPLDSDSEPEADETNASANSAQDSDTEVDEDVTDYVKISKKIANLSTQTVHFDIESQLSNNAKVSMNSNSINLHLSTQHDSDESIDLLEGKSLDMLLLAKKTAEAAKVAKNLSKIELEQINLSNSRQNDNEEFDDLTIKKKKSCINRISLSSNISSDSDSDDICNYKSIKDSSFRKPSGGNKSKFVLSDSDESDTDLNEKSNQLPKVVVNDSISDYDDSIVEKKFIGDISQECIPATQQETSLQPCASASFVLDVSHIEEITETTNLLEKSNAQPMNTMNQSAGSEELDKSASQHFDHIVAASQDSELVTDGPISWPTNNISLDSCDFLAPTQPLTRKRKSDTHTNTDKQAKFADSQTVCDFEAATQKLDDTDFLAPTQPIIHTMAETRDCDQDDYVFAAPTQPIRKCTASRVQKESEEFDFDAPTQALPDYTSCHRAIDDEEIFEAAAQPLQLQDKYALPATITQTDDVDFDSPTQPLIINTTKSKEKIGNVDILQMDTQPMENISTNNESEKQIAENDFEAPTQQINTEQSSNDEDNSTYTEADTQRIEDLFPVVKLKKVPEVESQLEVMFQSQNVSLTYANDSRPSNPMASFFDASSTQEVVEMLTGSGTKRNSDDFEDINKTKRVKATPQTSRTTRSNKGDTTKSKTAKKESSKTPSVLDLWEKENCNVKKVSKLSTIKSQQVSIVDSDESASDDEVECLADTIPIPLRETAQVDKQENEKRLEDISYNEKRLEDVTNNDKRLGDLMETPNTTPVAGSSKRRRRPLLDDESLRIITESLPTPELAEKRQSDRNKKSNDEVNKNLDVSNIVQPKKARGRKKAIDKGENNSGGKAVKRTTRSRQAKQTISKKSDSEEEKEQEVKTKEKITAAAKKNSTRTSARIKQGDDSKALNRRGRSKAVPLPALDESDDEIEEDIKIRVPRNQMKLCSADEDNAVQDISTIVEESLQTKPKRAGRPAKSKMEEVLPTPERLKRATKPKVVFTMLNDPQLNTIVRSLGGVIVDNLQACTVLVTKKVQRTLKLLSAIGNSIPICSPGWLYESKRAQTFLDPWDHLINDPEAEDQWKFQINSTFERRKKGKLFANYQFLLLISISVDVIKGAIEANGGKLVTRKAVSENLIVVAAANQKNKYDSFLKNKVMVVSSEAVLVGVLRQELVFNEFLLH